MATPKCFVCGRRAFDPHVYWVKNNSPNVHFVLDKLSHMPYTGSWMEDNMELRKHYTQMTPEEQLSLMLAVRTGKFVTTPYSEGRLAQRTLAPTTIQALQSYGKVIEAHKVGEDLRVLLRGKVKGQGACAVFSLTKGVIITAYKNEVTDHHSTLDKTIYNWTGEIKW